jgi:hypothetical protein
MGNNPEPIKEILEALFSLLEALETQSLALTQFLKDEGIASDEKLAPYLDRAGNASSVKWRAARARMQYLLSPVAKKTDDQEKEQQKEKEKEKGKEKINQGQNKKEELEKPPAQKQPADKPSTKEDQPKDSDDGRKAAVGNANAKTDNDQKPAGPKSAAEDNAKKSDTSQKSKSK